jgi:hypothetical protein
VGMWRSAVNGVLQAACWGAVGSGHRGAAAARERQHSGDSGMQCAAGKADGSGHASNDSEGSMKTGDGPVRLVRRPESQHVQESHRRAAGPEQWSL